MADAPLTREVGCAPHSLINCTKCRDRAYVRSLEDRVAELESQLAAAPPSPPVAALSGWRWVPVKPTDDMIEAADMAETRHMVEDRRRGGHDPQLSFSAAYEAMIAVAPIHPPADLVDQNQPEPYGERLVRLMREADAGVSSDVSEVDALEFRREQYGLTASDFAAVLGMQQSHYSEVVNQRRRLPINAVARAVVIGVPAAPLLAGRGIGHPTTPTPKDPA